MLWGGGGWEMLLPVTPYPTDCGKDEYGAGGGMLLLWNDSVMAG